MKKRLVMTVAILGLLLVGAKQAPELLSGPPIIIPSPFTVVVRPLGGPPLIVPPPP